MISNDSPFLNREDIKNKKLNYREEIVEEAKKIDLNNVNFSNNGGFKPRSEITKKQEVYFWIRVFLKEEDKKHEPNDDIIIKHVETGESLDAKFICHAKKGLERDHKGDIVNYQGDDDKKILCLMVNSEKIDKDSEGIPFLRSLFKIGRYYEYHLLKRDELLFIDKNGDPIEYYDVDF